jgi:hypothetical protein
LYQNEDYIGIARHHAPLPAQNVWNYIDLINYSRKGAETEEERNENVWGAGTSGAAIVAGAAGANVVSTVKKVSEDPSVFGPILAISPLGLYNYVFVEGIYDFFRPQN